MYDYIFDCDLLIIDDLGTEVNNSFVTSSLFLCMNERQIRSKSTVISTNLSLDKLQATYSERIMSRLISNYKIIHLFGEDIRIKKPYLKSKKCPFELYQITGNFPMIE